MVSCKDVSTKAGDYLDGELPLWSRVEIRLHIFFCQHCRRYLHQVELAVGALAQFASDDDEERAEEERIAQRLARARAGEAAQRGSNEP